MTFYRIEELIQTPTAEVEWVTVYENAVWENAIDIAEAMKASNLYRHLIVVCVTENIIHTCK